VTLQNVQRFLSEEITFILSPLGTPTTKVLIPLSQEGKILVLFPYTGGEVFRNSDEPIAELIFKRVDKGN
jgi:hypothetical protein